jgi:hypothetical protein
LHIVCLPVHIVAHILQLQTIFGAIGRAHELPASAYGLSPALALVADVMEARKSSMSAHVFKVSTYETGW